MLEIPDGIPKWSGHKGQSELMQEMTEDEGYVSSPPLSSPLFHSIVARVLLTNVRVDRRRIMPKYKGKKPMPEEEKVVDESVTKRARLL